jgi:hypothetical protein
MVIWVINQADAHISIYTFIIDIDGPIITDLVNCDFRILLLGNAIQIVDQHVMDYGPALMPAVATNEGAHAAGASFLDPNQLYPTHKGAARRHGPKPRRYDELSGHCRRDESEHQ